MTISGRSSARAYATASAAPQSQGRFVVPKGQDDVGQVDGPVARVHVRRRRKVGPAGRRECVDRNGVIHERPRPLSRGGVGGEVGAEPLDRERQDER